MSIHSQEQEIDGHIYKLRGQVEIHYGPYILYRQMKITYNSDTGEAIADGHVVLDGQTSDEHLQATHGTYNTRTGNRKV